MSTSALDYRRSASLAHVALSSFETTGAAVEEMFPFADVSVLLGPGDRNEAAKDGWLPPGLRIFGGRGRLGARESDVQSGKSVTRTFWRVFRLVSFRQKASPQHRPARCKADILPRDRSNMHGAVNAPPGVFGSTRKNLE